MARKLHSTILAASALVASLALTACGGGTGQKPVGQTGSTAAAPASTPAGPLTEPLLVWVDTARMDATKAFQAANPDIPLKVEELPATPDALHQKIQLMNRAGKGWPDLVFSSTTDDIYWATDPKAPFAAKLDDLVGSETLGKFAEGSLDVCKSEGGTYCLRNDIAQNVLWYDAKLMKEFGYTVPTTWEEFAELGKKVAKEHPGYNVGAVGDGFSPSIYYWASQCPMLSPEGSKTIKVNLKDPKCERVTTMLDELLTAKAMTAESVFDASYQKSYNGKVLMTVGPSWFGKVLFDSVLKTPKGRIAAAAPLKWEGDEKNWTGNVGGGIWMVSSHSKHPVEAAKAATWLSTDPELMAKGGTYPAYSPAAEKWLAGIKSDAFFAEDPSKPMQEAAGLIWPGVSSMPFDAGAIYKSTVVANALKGKKMADSIDEWQKNVTNMAKANGMTVNS